MKKKPVRNNTSLKRISQLETVVQDVSDRVLILDGALERTLKELNCLETEWEGVNRRFRKKNIKRIVEKEVKNLLEQFQR